MNIAENAFVRVRRISEPLCGNGKRLTPEQIAHVTAVLGRGPRVTERQENPLKDVSTKALLAELKRRGAL